MRVLAQIEPQSVSCSVDHNIILLLQHLSTAELVSKITCAVQQQCTPATLPSQAACNAFAVYRPSQQVPPSEASADSVSQQCTRTPKAALLYSRKPPHPPCVNEVQLTGRAHAAAHSKSARNTCRENGCNQWHTCNNTTTVNNEH